MSPGKAYNTQHYKIENTALHPLPSPRDTWHMNDLEIFLQQIRDTPETTEFKDVITLIDSHYDYTPASFSNGSGDEQVLSAAGENEGSCKIFSFAKIHGLTEEQTLYCFGQYYRDDVLQHPENTDHGNIRAFIKHGWQHVSFENTALKEKQV